MSDIPWLRRINNANNRTTLSPPSPSLQFVSLPSPPSTPRAFFKVSAIIPSWSSVLRRCHSRAGVAEPSKITKSTINYRNSIKIANCLFDNSINRVAVTSSSSEAPPDITRRCRRAGDELTPRWSLEQGNCHSKPPPKVNN